MNIKFYILGNLQLHHTLPATVEGWHALLVLLRATHKRSSTRCSRNIRLWGSNWIWGWSQLTCVWLLTFLPQSTCCQRRSRGWPLLPLGSSTSSPGSASCKPLCVCVCVRVHVCVKSWVETINQLFKELINKKNYIFFNWLFVINLSSKNTKMHLL